MKNSQIHVKGYETNTKRFINTNLGHSMEIHLPLINVAYQVC